MDKYIIQELENAANIIMAPPIQVSNDQRRAAEAVFLNFRKTKSPYNTCKMLLESAGNDYVKFEAVEAMKSALIREWVLLESEETLSLREYLMKLVCNIQFPPFVEERILQLIAIMVKRASTDDFGEGRKVFMRQIELIIMEADPRKQIIGCKLILNIIQEHAITNKSTDVGLPLRMHKKTKGIFENSDLHQIYHFSMSLLTELVRNDPPYPSNISTLMLYVLHICEAVLTWGNFKNGDATANETARLQLNRNWRDIMFSPTSLRLMFQAYWKVRDIEELRGYAMTCLVQLSSLHGTVFDSEENMSQEYLRYFMENFLNLITSMTIRSEEAIGIATVVLNIRLSFVKDITRLPQELQVSAFDEITKLTCKFIAASVEEDTLNGNFTAAFEILFEAWTLMVIEYKSLTDVFTQSSIQIFNTYLEYHLAPPDGRRPRDDDAVEEDEDNDRIKYKDHLEAVGLFGRVALDHSLPMLIRLLEDRTSKLGGRLHSMLQQAMTYNDSLELDNLFEDLHWLILIAGHTLCMSSDGETPLIPFEVMNHSIEQCNKGVATLEATLATLANVRQPGTQVTCVDKCDLAVRVFSNVLSLCTMEKQAHECNLGAFMSPEVGCTLMWFLNRWCLSYLLPTETYYAEFSPTIIGSLGKDTDGATFVSNFLLEKIQSNIFYSKDEAVLLRDTVEIFSEVVKDKSIYFVKTEGLWNLIKLQSTIPPGVLPKDIRQDLYKGFVLVGSCLTDSGEREEYYTQILKPVEQRLKAIVCQENFNRVYHQDQIKVELIDIIEKLIGISKGSKITTASLLFDFMSPILSELPVILGMYHNYQIIVHLVLQLFGQCAKNMLCHLDNSASRRLYESTYAVVQTYAKYNANRFSSDRTEEEDSLEDLSLLLDLLSYVLCKDWLDLGALSTSETNPLKASDVALYGLQFLMPLISLDLLRYPKLSLQYFRFLVLMSDMYPDRVLTMDDNLLANVIHSIELGMTKFHSDVVHVCFDFIETMATHVHGQQFKQCKLYQLLQPFLGLVLDMTLTKQIDADLIPSASTCIYSLCCLYREHYQSLVEGLIQSQSDLRVAERLRDAFTTLHRNDTTSCDPIKKRAFRLGFEAFIANVHGFLVIK